MAFNTRHEELFDSIARLRQAERETPRNRDIVTVRARLEHELGDTVSRRLAARILGVSHTGLARWIKSGDLAVVLTASGREQIPIAALLDLYEAVRREGRSGSGGGHVLERAFAEGRDRARRLRVEDLLPADSAHANGHGRAERRSLAYHRALAQRLDRPMIDDALHLLWQWRDQGKVDPRYAEQWEDVLDKPLAEVRRILSEESASARDLRQNSPFAGMLSEPERRKILAAVR